MCKDKYRDQQREERFSDLMPEYPHPCICPERTDESCAQKLLLGDSPALPGCLGFVIRKGSHGTDIEDKIGY